MIDWSHVEDEVARAQGIAWDGCHKIYVLMDGAALGTQIDYGYRQNEEAGGSRLFLRGEVEFFSTIKEWWQESCCLKFITAVTSDRYDDLIAQGADEEDEGDS